MFRRRHRTTRPGPESAETSAPVTIKLQNHFAGQTHRSELCSCSSYFGPPDPDPWFQVHAEPQDTECEAWQILGDLIEEAARDGREEFIPGNDMSEEMWRLIVTLPPSIAKLGSVKRFSL